MYHIKIAASDSHCLCLHCSFGQFIFLYGDALDATAFIVEIWNASSNSSNPDQAPGTGIRYYVGEDYNPGDLQIEINSGNANNWVQVLLVGGMGILDSNTYDTLSNRNGIGALIRFYPIESYRSSLYHCNKLSDIEDYYGNQIFIPLIAGESHVAQNALRKTFGLGDNRRSAVDIRWPSGNRNVLFYLKRNTFYRIYEIPLSYDDCGLTVQQIRNTINDVGDEYGLTNAEIRQYRRSFRLKWYQTCKDTINSRASLTASHHSSGNYIYIYVVACVLALLLCAFGAAVIIRKRAKNQASRQQRNLQKDLAGTEVTKVSSHSEVL